MRTNLSLAQRSLTAALSLSFTHFATAGNRGVVDGPAECANVQAEKRSDALDYSHRPVYAVPNDFLQRPAVRDHLYLESEH
jgi:hypothetical protein